MPPDAAYLSTYIINIFYGSVIHLRNTFQLRLSKNLYLKQLAILAFAGIVAISILQLTSSFSGPLTSGVIAITTSAAINLILGVKYLKET